MSEPAQVEVRRLAVLLGCQDTDLAYLGSHGAQALGRLRQGFAKAVIERQRPRLERLAQASALLPPSLAAHVAEQSLGPVLIAALAPFLSPRRAAQLGERLSAAFLADVACHLVPDAAAPLLAALPQALLSSCLIQLLARREYAVMGSVVEYLSTDAVAQLSREITDPAELLAITAYVGDKRCLSPVVSRFDDNTVLQLLRCAAEGAGMPLLAELYRVLDARQRSRLQRLLPQLPAAARAIWAGTPLVPAGP